MCSSTERVLLSALQNRRVKRLLLEAGRGVSSPKTLNLEKLLLNSGKKGGSSRGNNLQKKHPKRGKTYHKKGEKLWRHLSGGKVERGKRAPNPKTP